ncbi:PD-(D/E)XK motif protein [Nocardioides marinus]|nr:PD-(D/E)XK motif protein [Nocardioides marinus]
MSLGPILLGVDRESRLHLLVPIPASVVADDRVSNGIDLAERELLVGGDAVRFADLQCRLPRLSKPFEQLVDDILGRLAAEPESGIRAVLAALEDWRALLRRAVDGLSREEVLGLVGELEVMTRLAAHNPTAAVEGWTGPDRQSRDFRRGGKDIEVKASSAVSPTSVRISNLDQLDPGLSSSLCLVLAHLSLESDAPDIEERIEILLDLGVPIDALTMKLRELGYLRGMELTVPSRYRLRQLHWWMVDANFPGLRASDIESSRLAAVDQLSYDLILAALPPSLSESAVEKFVEDWSQ